MRKWRTPLPTRFNFIYFYGTSTATQFKIYSAKKNGRRCNTIMLMLRMREFADRKSKNWKCTKKKVRARGKWHWRVVALQMASNSAALSPPSASANVRNWYFCAQLWLWIYFTSLCNKFLHTIDFCFWFDRKTPSSKEKSPVTFDELQELVKKLAKYIATQMHSTLFLGNNVDQLIFSQDTEFTKNWAYRAAAISFFLRPELPLK